MKKTLAFIMAILTTFTALSFGACNGAGTSDSSTGKEQVDVPEKQPESNITATIVRPDQTYNFCSEIAFLGSDLAATSESGYEAVSAELVATVEPIDANQNVNWAVSFKNASSTWANGKAVSDYVTVTPKSAGSTTATVTCKAPFGEQIVITCTSQENADIFAECTVDFVQTVESVSLTFGDDLPINLGGETGIEWEMNPNGIGNGGAANVNVETYDTYTIATDTYSWEIDLISPDYYYNGVDDETWGTLVYNTYDSNDLENLVKEEKGDLSLSDKYADMKTTSGDWYNGAFKRYEDINSLIFDYNFADTSAFFGSAMSREQDGETNYFWSAIKFTSMLTDTTAFFFAMDYSNLPYVTDWSQFNGTLTEASMYTLRLTLKNSTETVEFLSVLKWEAFTNNPLVQSVSFANSALKF